MKNRTTEEHMGHQESTKGAAQKRKAVFVKPALERQGKVVAVTGYSF